MKTPNPEFVDDENPEWTDKDFAAAVPFSALPAEVQQLLSSPKRVLRDARAPSKEEPAA